MRLPRAKHLHLQRMARRVVAGVAGAAVAARTGGQRGKQVHLGEQLDKVPCPGRAPLHEIPVRVAREARTHEHVDHVVHVRFGLGKRQVPRRRKGAGEIGVAAVVVGAARQQVVRIGVAARADHVMHTGAKRVDTVPVQGIAGDGRHRPQPRQGAPQAVAGADVGAVQGAGLAAEEALAQVGSVPQVQVADLRAVGGDDAKQVAGRDFEGARLPRRHDQLLDQRQIPPHGLVEGLGRPAAGCPGRRPTRVRAPGVPPRRPVRHAAHRRPWIPPDSGKA